MNIKAMIATIAMIVAVEAILIKPVQAAFPGANGVIAFTVHERGAIKTINPDGTGTKLIFPGTPNATSYAAWSANGKRLAVSHGVGRRDIWVMNANGSAAKKLTNTPNDELFPVWSPDGSKIIFNTDRDGNSEIYVMNSDGTNPVRLTNNSAWDGAASWSPDGTKIAFNSLRHGNSEIYMMNANGTNQVRLTYNSAEDVLPDWSPDGAKIAFHSNRDHNNQIYVMDANGSNQTRLTNTTTHDESPKWSPDGTKISFKCNYGKKDDICTIAPDGSNKFRLTNVPYPGYYYTTWQPIPTTNKTITVDDTGFSPSITNVLQGWKVRWNFMGGEDQSVVDDLALGLFGSGMEPKGGAYATTFYDAGTYLTFDPTTLQTGTINVPMKVAPSSGSVGTTFMVTWSVRTAPRGSVFDIQKKVPGSTAWTYHLRGVEDNKTTMAPTISGKYQFRSRLRKARGATYWSPVSSFTVN